MPDQDLAQLPAVILAAGQGTRLTSDLPKCLTLVRGRPLISWIVDALAQAGCRDIWMVLGSQAETIEQALPSLSASVMVKSVRCSDWSLGNGQSAAHAEGLLREADRFLLLMSDHLIGAQHVRSLLVGVQPTPSACVLATCPIGSLNVDIGDATKVSIESDDRITAIGKSLSTYNGIDTGVFLMSRDLFPALRLAQAQGDYSLTGGNRVLASAGLLYSLSIGDLPWQDVDTPSDLAQASEIAESISAVASPNE